MDNDRVRGAYVLGMTPKQLRVLLSDARDTIYWELQRNRVICHQRYADKAERLITRLDKAQDMIDDVLE